MQRFAIAISLFIAAPALAESTTDEGWNLPSQGAPKELGSAATYAEKTARELSAQGDYAGAADLVERFVIRFRRNVSAGQKYIVNNDAKVGAAYRKRANWAAAGSPAALRSLLLDLMDSKVIEIERAETIDARVLSLLKKLRAADLETNAFFNRHVQLSISPTGNIAPKVVEIVERESLADLHAAGFNAISEHADDVLTLTATQNGIDVSKLAFNVPSAVGDAIPCNVKLKGHWTTGKRVMFRSLAVSATAKADSHPACLTKAARAASGKMTLAVVHAFLRGNWLQRLQRVERKFLQKVTTPTTKG